MIVKILTRSSPSFKSLVSYIIKGSKDKNGNAQVITHNLRSSDMDGYVKEFLANEATRKYNHSRRTYLYHEILSASVNDKGIITDEMFNDLARKYISFRGKQGLFFGAIHRDKEHIHIHFCVSGTEYRTGKAFRLSRAALKELKISFQEYHVKKYPELTHSTVGHGQNKEYVTDREWYARHKQERALLKDQVQAIVQECLNTSTTQQQFLELLRDNNLPHYEVKGIPAGIIISNNFKIRFTRMNITKEQLDNLRPDRTEEEKELAAIRSIRERSRTPERSKEATRKPGEREKEPGIWEGIERPVREQMAAYREMREMGAEKDEPEMD